MKISYVTTYDASNIHNWSGLGYYIAKMLENQNAEINYVGNLKIPREFLLKFKRIAYKKLLNKTFLINRDLYLAKQFSDQIERKLKYNTDIVFSPSSLPIALLETKKPKVFYTDATFAGMVGFYDNFSNLCNETIKNGNYLEKMALESSKLAIYSSDWAAKTAIENYGISAEKVKIVPFGANISCDRKLENIKSIVENRSKKSLNLLFLGVEWERKGGNFAVKITEKLNEMGLRTELHVIGINKIPLNNLPTYIINHGYISKATQQGMEQIEEILINSHFLLLPSVADCTPIVYSEANSYGLPCITTDVGGISTIVKDDINGKKFSLSTDINEWVNYISEHFLNKTRYKELCISSFNEYESRLNWSVAGKAIKQLLNEV